MVIKDIKIKEIFDSRGKATIEVELVNVDGIRAKASVPSGKSRGSREAAVLNFTEAQKAVEEAIKLEVLNRNFNSVKELDERLIRLDATENKSRLGGNTILGISIAFVRLLAQTQKKEDWEILNSEFFSDDKNIKLPMIFSNLINGGAHANNNLNIQEYMAIVRPKDFIKSAVDQLKDFYKSLGEELKEKYNIKELVMGDEAGYVLDFPNNFEPINLLEGLIKEFKIDDFVLGLDVAASGFHKENNYLWEKKNISSEELLRGYLRYFKESELLYSIEDPFAENDFEGFKKLSAELKDKLVVGDDLTTTNPEQIKKFTSEGLINAVIIKPNQIGSVSEACQAIKEAKSNNAKTIISHRSGETDDVFIIHLAKASNADGVKIGAPARERIIKFDELARLYR